MTREEIVQNDNKKCRFALKEVGKNKSIKL